MWHNISAWALNVNPIIYKIVLYMNIMEKEHCNIRVIIIMVVCRFPGSIMTIPSGTMFFFGAY